MHLPYYPVIPLLDIYTKEMKIYVHTKASTQLFIAAVEWINDSVIFIQRNTSQQQKGSIIQTTGTHEGKGNRDLRMHYAECKKPDSKGHTPYVSIYTTFGKRQNYRGRREIRGCQGLWVEGRKADYKVTEGNSSGWRICSIP